jgi:hypothetical protein
MTLGCELVWTTDMGAQAQRMIEDATGLPCPCKRGLTCPLLAWLTAERRESLEKRAA